MRSILGFVAVSALGFLATEQALAATTQTLTGTLATDDAIAFYSLVLSAPSSFSISTDSYGGGSNLDGTITTPGGFVPIISLFAPNGDFIADDGADGHAPGRVDPTTGIADDAAFVTGALGPGDYTLAVTEFYNFPNGNLSDGFFAAGTGNFTGDICGTTGSFLQVDLASCPQRTDAFTVNVASTVVPEPASWAMTLVGFGLAGAALRRTMTAGRGARRA